MTIYSIVCYIFLAIYIYQISDNDNFFFSSSMPLVIMVLVLPVLINSLVTEKLITFLSFNYLIIMIISQLDATSNSYFFINY